VHNELFFVVKSHTSDKVRHNCFSFFFCLFGLISISGSLVSIDFSKIEFELEHRLILWCIDIQSTNFEETLVAGILFSLLRSFFILSANRYRVHSFSSEESNAKLDIIVSAYFLWAISSLVLTLPMPLELSSSARQSNFLFTNKIYNND
jgi:tellurite resistance protein TehA-like permease